MTKHRDPGRPESVLINKVIRDNNLFDKKDVKKAFRKGYLDNKTTEELIELFKTKKVKSIEEIFAKEKERRKEQAEQAGVGDISSYYRAVSYEDWLTVKHQNLANKSYESPDDDHSDIFEHTFDADNHYINNEPIPYDKWQYNPQLWGHWDIESTPKIRSIYSGEAGSFFYDDMPEDHPNYHFIRNFFNYLNKPLEEIDSAYGEFLKSILESASEHLIQNVERYLTWLINKLVYESEVMIANAQNEFIREFGHLEYTIDSFSSYSSTENEDESLENEMRSGLRNLAFVESSIEFIPEKTNIIVPENIKIDERYYPNVEQIFINTLKAIEDDYRIEFMKRTFLARDEIILHNILTNNEKHWKEEHKRGNSPYKEIKRFGKMLHKEFKDEMRKVSKEKRDSVWARYYINKNKYSPMIIYQNIDINKANPGDIVKAINTPNFTRACAGDIMNIRPFDNIGELFWQKSFDTEKLTTNEFVKASMDLFVDKIEEAFDKKDFTILSKEAQVLRHFQNSRDNNLSNFDWESIWSFYRVVKAALTNLNSIIYFEDLNSKELKIKQIDEKTK